MAGSHSSIDVFLSLHGQRKFSKELSAAGTELEAMGVRGAKSMERFARTSQRFKSFGHAWTRNISLPVAGLGFIAGKMAVDFNRSMSLVQTQAGASAKETKFLESGVLGLAKASKFGPTEAANALFRVRSAGFKANEALDVLKQGMNLSTVGNSDLEMTTKALTGAAKTLGLSKPGQLKGLGAEMNAIVGSGDMRMEELQDALSSGVLPAFVNAGLGIRDFGTSLTVMTDRNVPAAMAATRLRMVVGLLAAPTKKAADALGEIGLKSNTLAEIMRRKNLPAAIQTLYKHLYPKGIAKSTNKELTKAGQALNELGGGSKSSAVIKTLVGNADELSQKWNLIAGGVGKYNKQVKHAEEQPGFKLEKAWSNIQVSLVKLGDQLLPVVVPGFEKLTGVLTHVGNAFASLSPQMQGSIAGFLLLTGPVASGLGYFAGGVGKALVLTSKLGKAMSIFNSTMSASVMTERSGLRGAFGAAFGGSGFLAQLKGLAYSLKYAGALAAGAFAGYEIVGPATEGKFATAGVTLGYSLAGGILGAVAGSIVPGLGTALGGALGAAGGGWVGQHMAKLMGLDSKTSPLQEKLAKGSKESTYWFGEQAKASKALGGAERRLVLAHQRQHSAIQGVKTAQSHLTAMIRKYGPDTRPVIRAEGALAQKRWGVAKATQAIHDKEKLRGIALAGAKASTRWAIGSEKGQIHLLGLRAKRLGHLLHYEQFHGASRERLGQLGKRIGNVLSGLHEEERKLKITGGNAAKRIGEKWTNNMMKMSVAMLKFETRPFETKLDHLGKNPGPRKLTEAFQEIDGSGLLDHLSRKIEHLNQKAEELESRQFPNFSIPGLTPEPTGPHGGVGPHKGNQPHHRHKGSGRHRNLMAVPAPRVLRLEGFGADHSGSEITIKVPVELDGKVLSESVARHSTKAATLT